MSPDLGTELSTWVVKAGNTPSLDWLTELQITAFSVASVILFTIVRSLASVLSAPPSNTRTGARPHRSKWEK